MHRNALAPGTRLHWYTLGEVLGQGGFGITYLAHDTNLARRVAIKEYLPGELALRDPDSSVHPSSTENEETYRWGLERFVTEGRTLARFDHPNIVRVMAVFEANNTAYLVMRYEEGTTLAEILRGGATLGEDRLLGILLPLLDGLELVHAEGFVHRDIKPANIFLRGDASPVLIDFGSARQAVGRHTRTLTTLVSPGYAPFEQYSDRTEEQGPWTDIYAIAATMYRGLAGTAPPDAVDRSHRLHGDEPDPLVPAAQVGEGRYSRGFLEAIDWGLRFRRQDRPLGIAPWREAVVARSDAATARAPKAFVPGSAQAGVDAEAETAVRTGSGGPPTAVLEEPEPAPARRGRRVAIAAAVAVAGLGLVGALLLANRPPGPGDATTEVADAASSAPSTPRGADGDARAQRGETPAPRSASDTRTVRTLLEEARRHAEAGRTLFPVGENAFETYRTALARDPGNEEARRGLRHLVEAEVGDALAAVARKHYGRAQVKLDRLVELVPDSDRLAAIRERVRRARAESR